MKRLRQKFYNRSATISELFGFFGQHKLWWMFPMLVAVIMVGLMMMFVNASPLMPFVYPLF